MKAANSDEKLRMRSEKELEKSSKRGLTKAKRCGKIIPAAEERRVPCKLNNVTNTKHQKEMVV